MGKEDCNEGYLRLMEAILKQARNDYKKCLRILKINPKDKTVVEKMEEIEDFYNGSLVVAMVEVDPKKVINSIIEECVAYEQ